VTTRGLAIEDRTRLAPEVRAALERVLRPSDGGSAERPDLGPF
jgi:hypothetical protein